MKKMFMVFIIVMIIGTMFTGCGKNEAVAENKGQHVVEEIIFEDIIVEEIIVEDIVVEDVWVSSEYWAELGFNSQTNVYP